MGISLFSFHHHKSSQVWPMESGLVANTTRGGSERAS